MLHASARAEGGVVSIILSARQMRNAIHMRKQGTSVAAIAVQLGVSPRTLERRLRAYDAEVKAGRVPTAGRGRQPIDIAVADEPVAPAPDHVWTEARRIAANRMLRAGRGLPVIAAWLTDELPGAPVETAHITAAFRGAPWVQLRGAA
jgi:hypothetical protein